MIKEIKISNNDIKKIAHISDVHIRPYKRHKEFLHVFNNLYKSLKKQKPDLIVLTGDIVHSKTEMSPELISITDDFFKKLCEISFLLVVPGNHDANLNNPNRMDALTPILEISKSDKIYYFRNSGTIKINNLYFQHLSVFDNESKYPSVKSIPEGATSICLYHGVVSNSKNEFGYSLTHDKVNINTFDGYTYAMLGDIHKYQWLTKNIAYAGSLLQNTHGESLNHGYIMWNLDSNDHEFVNVHNDWGFYTLEINSEELPDIEDMPKHVRLRLKTQNLDSGTINNILKKIRKKWNPIEITINRSSSESSVVDYDSVYEIDVTDVNYQNNLLSDYVKDNHPELDQSDINQIISINNEVNNNITNNDFQTGIKWQLNYLKWDNLFSYGEDNMINFKKLNGVVGINGPNRVGKCVDKSTEIQIKFNEEEIIKKLGFLPDELK